MAESTDTVKLSREVEVPKEVRVCLGLALSRINRLAKEDFVEEDLHTVSTHLLKSPGKLVRPGLVFSTAIFLGEDPKKYVDLAVGIELLHVSSLVHDDIIDKDATRRGKEAVHAKFGTEKAILAGDALIAKAISLASAYGGKAVSMAAAAAMNMCAGEVLDLNVQTGKTQIDLHTYLRIAQLKTASLIATSTGIVADCTGSELTAQLYDIGTNIGYSFQLRDDIMNHMGVNERRAKPVQTDAANSRPNIVDVFAGHNKGSPLKTAIKLNNFYIDRAAELLYGMENTGIFERYLDFLKIEA